MRGWPFLLVLCCMAQEGLELFPGIHIFCQFVFVVELQQHGETGAGVDGGAVFDAKFFQQEHCLDVGSGAEGVGEDKIYFSGILFLAGFQIGCQPFCCFHMGRMIEAKSFTGGAAGVVCQGFFQDSCKRTVGNKDGFHGNLPFSVMIDCLIVFSFCIRMLSFS